MGLRIQPKAFQRMRTLSTLIAVLALAFQPLTILSTAPVSAAPQQVTVTVTPKNYSPGQEEAVEFTNNGSKPVDLSGLYVTELVSGSPVYYFSVPKGTILSTGETYIHYSTGKINNTGDTITIYTDSSRVSPLVSVATNKNGEAATGILALEEVAAAPAPLPAVAFSAVTGDYGGYKGISIDAAYENTTTLTGVDIAIARENGGTVTKSATANMITYLQSRGSQTTTLTTPFVVVAGSYNEAAGSAWTVPNATWNETTVPTSATITMTFSDQASVVKTVLVSQGNASYASFAPKAIVPAITKVDPYFVKDRYKGIQVDITTKDITTAQAIEVRIHRQNADDFVKTAKQPALDAINSGNTTTAPFAIQTDITDIGTNGWSAPAGQAWTSETVPTGATVTITLKDGRVIGPVSQSPIATSLATMAEVMPEKVVDTAAPVVSNPVISPITRDNLMRATVKVEFTMTDESPINVSKGLTHVRFMNGAAATGEVNSAAYAVEAVPGKADRYVAYVATEDFVPAGQTIERLRLYIRAQDSLGNKTSYAFFKNQLTVDHTPAVGKVTHINDKPFSRSEPIVTTQNGKFTVRGTVNDNKAINRVGVQLVKPKVSGQIQHLYANDNKLYGATGDVAWSTVFDTQALALTDGRYGLNLSYVDKVGNVSKETVFFTLDTTAPDAMLTLTPAAGTTSSAQGAVTVTGSVAAEPNIKSHWFEITDPAGRKTYQYNLNTSQKSYSFELDTAAGDGVYSVRYVATDHAGNRSDSVASAVQSVTVQNTPVDGGDGGDDDGTETPPADGGEGGTPQPGNPAVTPPASVQTPPVNTGSLGPLTAVAASVASLGAITGTPSIATAATNAAPSATTDTTDSAVLGVADEKVANQDKIAQKSSDRQVLGTTNDTAKEECWKILGLCWYWWLAIIAGVITLWYGATRVRRDQAQDM